MAIRLPRALLSCHQFCSLPQFSFRRPCCSIPPALVQRSSVRYSSSAESCSRFEKKKLVFLGTPGVVARVLDDLLDASQMDGSLFQIAAIVTQPPAAPEAGDGSNFRHLWQLELLNAVFRPLIWSPEKVSEEAILELERSRLCASISK